MDKEEVEKQKREYFKLLGWDEQGIPTEETIEELGINFLKPAIKKLKERAGSA